MTIGVDVDGVLVNQAQYQLHYGTEYFKEKYGIQVSNPKAFDIRDIFECTKEQREDFWKKYIWRYCLKEPITGGAVQTARALRENGHKIYIVTGRAHTTEKGLTGILFRFMLKYWLWKNRFPYDEIFFCSEDDSSKEKLNICRAEKIDVMVDDKPENLLALKGSTKILCYPAPWNESNKDLDEFRISRFEDILLKL